MLLCGLPWKRVRLPLVLGAGARSASTSCYVEGRESGGPLLPRSTFRALLFNGLTTVVGFGSLMTAAHRGIFGLGLLLTLGMMATLDGGFGRLPHLVGIAGGTRPQQRATASVQGGRLARPPAQ